ncbi:hypothetical protein IscW_ISCW011385 [Ixodes scapularis]|uniref:Uncharacterized protein n=1 Tax=Ixodes scapularis TaxID=6945 RepID=B7Q5M3_IXOSC|nr:hypothetical protein IscW_ISCW011385 [Ixodes scapularis]|eukprot:XP_002411793.1 hypothetical protein IscW_ISCW011385 [Ixodes scapularis]
MSKKGSLNRLQSVNFPKACHNSLRSPLLSRQNGMKMLRGNSSSIRSPPSTLLGPHGKKKKKGGQTNQTFLCRGRKEAEKLIRPSRLQSPKLWQPKCPVPLDM